MGQDEVFASGWNGKWNELLVKFSFLFGPFPSVSNVTVSTALQVGQVPTQSASSTEFTGIVKLPEGQELALPPPAYTLIRSARLDHRYKDIDRPGIACSTAM